MIRARHNFFIYPMFKILTKLMIRKNFKSVNILGEFEDYGNAILVLSNHVSWWDGFWIMYLNQKVLRRKFYFMMLEEQLRKHWYFIFSGGFSVKKKSRSIFETIDYTASLLTNNENMVLIFPQGKINSIYNANIKFQKGIERILEKSPKGVQILFVVNLIDYFSHKKPSVYIYIKSYKSDEKKIDRIEFEYNKFFSEALSRQSV